MRPLLEIFIMTEIFIKARRNAFVHGYNNRIIKWGTSHLTLA